MLRLNLEMRFRILGDRLLLQDTSRSATQHIPNSTQPLLQPFRQPSVFQVLCLPAPPAAESVLRCTFSSFQFSALLATGGEIEKLSLLTACAFVPSL